MTLLIICYSHSGNNRLLAEHLGRLLGARVVGVVEKRKRTGLTMVLDMVFKRRSAIHDLGVSPKAYDHVLLIAPLWNKRVANPMRSAIEQIRGELDRYSFVSLCGHERPGQSAHVTRELERLVGKAPERVWELHVCELVAPEQKTNVTVVSAHKVIESELEAFQTKISEMAAYFR
ncbi:MAG TPA: hypothetical protein PL143_03335 [Rhodocyclaceae bacterium]|nr:hypothetical protein [Rhodocyclaceae bacterium]